LKAWSAELNKTGTDPAEAQAASIPFAAEAARRAALEMRDALRSAVQKQQTAHGDAIESN